MGIGRRSFQGVGVRLVLLTLLAVAGIAAWLTIPEAGDDDSQPAAATAQAPASPQTVVWLDRAAAAPAEEAAPGEPPATAGTDPFTVERSPIEGLRISRQFWRRGGLGSKALVTLTLRNRNDYPVKDIEIACAFARADGSHLTDRRRVIADTINTKSRKTYAGMLVGFVNVNANRARCSVVTASRA